ncbi:unnamed protein product [Acanthoscelides obtectus]|uniref:Peroxisomal membrane protein 11B n=1 Tax=Acanthoscelides obtectus TaxID=200917 RepID=A0A9P0JI29_ACAOB|nr:unnamed protein product [Acanthoscelides obtectus]CAK1624985.1 Peroxisomal membrane protein 11B [Acanthoscelides obtectus]
MDILVKINNQTNGRDKEARLLQYLSRLLWYRFQQSNIKGVQGLKNIEYQLSTFRKFLRFGRFVESLYATLPLFHEENAVLRYTIILSKIANSLFLLADHLLLLGRADFCPTDTQKWSRISNKYWLYSITMNLMRDFYEIYNILNSEKRIIMPKNGLRNLEDFKTLFLRSFMVLVNHQDILIDTVKNCCDFFIPYTALGHANLSPGTVGLLGSISSLMGLLVLINPENKLIPQ